LRVALASHLFDSLLPLSLSLDEYVDSVHVDKDSENVIVNLEVSANTVGSLIETADSSALKKSDASSIENTNFLPKSHSLKGPDEENDSKFKSGTRLFALFGRRLSLF
jgi:hypothetical protein